MSDFAALDIAIEAYRALRDTRLAGSPAGTAGPSQQECAAACRVADLMIEMVDQREAEGRTAAT